MTVRPGGARRYGSDQPKAYIRKIGGWWVVSGGWHLGMQGYHTWRGAMDEVGRMQIAIALAIDDLLAK
jgi:hypothetical protein